MVDYVGVAKGIAWFIVGVIFTAIAWYAVPPIIEIIPESYVWLRGLGWLVIIAIGFISMAVLPIYQIVTAMKGD